MELVGTGANVGELAIYVEAPIAIGRSIPAIGLTIERRINAVEEPAPRRFASIKLKAGLLKEILGSGACLETRLARRSPNLEPEQKHGQNRRAAGRPSHRRTT